METYKRVEQKLRANDLRLVTRNGHSPFSIARICCPSGHTWSVTWEYLQSARQIGPCAACEGKSRRRDRVLIRVCQAVEEHEGAIIAVPEICVWGSRITLGCSQGHRWETSVASVLGGSWCVTCAFDRMRLSLDILRKLAAERGGECLSSEYINGTTKVLWRCHCGHEWSAIPSNVLYNGSWCPLCAGHIAYTIEEIRKLAEELGGECLSSRYKNNKTPLLWKCSEGHIWKKNAHSILRGIWCPVCARKKRRRSQAA